MAEARSSGACMLHKVAMCQKSAAQSGLGQFLLKHTAGHVHLHASASCCHLQPLVCTQHKPDTDCVASCLPKDNSTLGEAPTAFGKPMQQQGCYCLLAGS